jgi:hypothetical protein
MLGDTGFASVLTGDLIGCLYAFVTDYKYSSGWICREKGTIFLVSNYHGKDSTFEVDYQFRGKFEKCNVPKRPKFYGRCHHQVIMGSGIDVFEGVIGRLDFKDDVEAGWF